MLVTAIWLQYWLDTSALLALVHYSYCIASTAGIAIANTALPLLHLYCDYCIAITTSVLPFAVLATLCIAITVASCYSLYHTMSDYAGHVGFRLGMLSQELLSPDRST